MKIYLAIALILLTSLSWAAPPPPILRQFATTNEPPALTNIIRDIAGSVTNTNSTASVTLDDFTVAQFGDIQNCVKTAQGQTYFSNSITWLITNKTRLNLKAVTFPGDVTDDSATTAYWTFATNQFGRLSISNIAVYASAGNHDQAGSHTPWNTYMGPLLSTQPGYALSLSAGDYYGTAWKQTNSTVKLLFVSLGYAVDAADFTALSAFGVSAARAYPDHAVIYITHGYLSQAGIPLAPPDSHYAAGINGIDWWDNCFSLVPNSSQVLCGHDWPGDFAHHTQYGPHMNRVDSMLVDFQDAADGGGQYVRLYRWQPSRSTILAQTYNTATAAYITTAGAEFQKPISGSDDQRLGTNVIANTGSFINGVGFTNGLLSFLLNSNNVAGTKTIGWIPKLQPDWSIEWAIDETAAPGAGIDAPTATNISEFQARIATNDLYGTLTNLINTASNTVQQFAQNATNDLNTTLRENITNNITSLVNATNNDLLIAGNLTNHVTLATNDLNTTLRQNITNHVQLATNELASTNWVLQQIANIGLHLYSSGITNTGALAGKTNNWQALSSPVTTVSTNSLTGISANDYVRNLVSTQTFYRIESGPISVKTYLFRSGTAGGTVSLHPEVYLYDTASNTLPVEIVAPPAQEITENTPTLHDFSVSANSISWTNPFKIMLSWKMDSTPLPGTYVNFVSGGSYDSHFSFVQNMADSVIDISHVIGLSNALANATNNDVKLAGELTNHVALVAGQTTNHVTLATNDLSGVLRQTITNHTTLATNGAFSSASTYALNATNNLNTTLRANITNHVGLATNDLNTTLRQVLTNHTTLATNGAFTSASTYAQTATNSLYGTLNPRLAHAVALAASTGMTITTNLTGGTNLYTLSSTGSGVSVAAGTNGISTVTNGSVVTVNFSASNVVFDVFEATVLTFTNHAGAQSNMVLRLDTSTNVVASLLGTNSMSAAAHEFYAGGGTGVAVAAGTNGILATTNGSVVTIHYTGTAAVADGGTNTFASIIVTNAALANNGKVTITNGTITASGGGTSNYIGGELVFTNATLLSPTAIGTNTPADNQILAASGNRMRWVANASGVSVAAGTNGISTETNGTLVTVHYTGAGASLANATNNDIKVAGELTNHVALATNNLWAATEALSNTASNAVRTFALNGTNDLNTVLREVITNHTQLATNGAYSAATTFAQNATNDLNTVLRQVITNHTELATNGAYASASAYALQATNDLWTAVSAATNNSFTSAAANTLNATNDLSGVLRINITNHVATLNNPVTNNDTRAITLTNLSYYDVSNVKFYGAKGDGETDDTAAIQAAMDAASAGKFPVHIPDGDYLVTAPLIVPTNTMDLQIIKGYGANKTRVLANFSGVETQAVFYAKGTFGTTNDHRAFVSLEDLAITRTAGNTNLDAVYIEFGGGLNGCTRVVISGGFRTGIRIGGSFQALIDQSTVVGCWQDGIITGIKLDETGGSCNNVNILGGAYSANGRHGLFPYFARAVSIHGVTAEANGGNNLYAQYCYGLGVYGLYTESQTTGTNACIKMLGCEGSDLSAINISVRPTNTAAIWVESCQGARFSGLSMEAGFGDERVIDGIGILITNSSSVTIENSYIRNVVNGIVGGGVARAAIRQVSFDYVTTPVTWPNLYYDTLVWEGANSVLYADSSIGATAPVVVTDANAGTIRMPNVSLMVEKLTVGVSNSPSLAHFYTNGLSEVVLESGGSENGSRFRIKRADNARANYIQTETGGQIDWIFGSGLYDDGFPSYGWGIVRSNYNLAEAVFFVATNGNIGIGTPSPVAKLDVNGSIKTVLTNKTALATDANGIIVEGTGGGQTNVTFLNAATGIGIGALTNNGVINYWLTNTSEGGSIAFSGVTAGENTAALTVGTGGSLAATGSGSITATAIPAAVTNASNFITANGNDVLGTATAATNALHFTPVLNVKKPPFNAAGNGSDNDTAELQLALDTAAYTNGASRKVYLPAGTYLIDAALVWPTNWNGIELFGEGTADFSPDTAKTIIKQSTAAANGIEFIASADNRYVLRPYIHDVSIVGVTNGATGAGIKLGNSYIGPYGSVEFARFERVTVSGFSTGFDLRDTVSTVLDQCAWMYNTNIGLYAYRADTMSIRSCWGGFSRTPGTDDHQTAMWFDGMGWIHIFGGEFGNCKRVLYQDGNAVVTWIDGNIESIYGTEAILNTNLSSFTMVGGRYAKTSGNTVPLVRMNANPDGQIASLVTIINPTWDASTNIVTVEGNYSDLPHVLCQQTMTPPVIQKHSSIGGAVTTSYYGSGILDINNPSTITAANTFTGKQRFLNGTGVGSLELGGDSGASTATANTAKAWTITSPSYANNAGTWQNSVLSYMANDTANALYLGGQPSQYGATHVYLQAASTVDEIAATRATITSSAVTLADGVGLVVDTGDTITLGGTARSTWPSEAATGDSATAFFSSGQIERARGGTGADTSAYGAGLFGSDSGNNTIDIDTEGELETALGGIDIPLPTQANVFTAKQRFQNGTGVGSMEVGANDGGTTVTANNNKTWTLTTPSYANDGTTWNNSILSYQANNTANILYLGGQPSQFGMTHLYLQASSALGEIATTRATLTSSALALSAGVNLIGAHNSVYYGLLTSLTNATGQTLGTAAFTASTAYDASGTALNATNGLYSVLNPRLANAVAVAAGANITVTTNLTSGTNVYTIAASAAGFNNGITNAYVSDWTVTNSALANNGRVYMTNGTLTVSGGGTSNYIGGTLNVTNDFLKTNNITGTPTTGYAPVIQSSGAINWAQVATVSTFTNSKSFTFAAPTATENVTLLYTMHPITLDGVVGSAQGSSPSVTFNIAFASTRNTASSNLVFSANQALDQVAGETFTITDTTLEAGWIWFVTTATSGTVTDANITIHYH